MDEEFVILFIVAIIALIAAGVLFLTSSDYVSVDTNFSFDSKQTFIEVLSNNSLHNNDSFEIKLTENGKPDVNKSVNVTFADINQNLNTITLKTDSNGIAKTSLSNITSGNYTVVCEFDDNTYFYPMVISLEVLP